MFEDIRNLEPWRMEGMEVYSTVLWHMQQETALSALAQDLVDIDKLSPEVCCNILMDNSSILIIQCIDMWLYLLIFHNSTCFLHES